jgi:hypothetical protein
MALLICVGLDQAPSLKVPLEVCIFQTPAWSSVVGSIEEEAPSNPAVHHQKADKVDLWSPEYSQHLPVPW